MTSPEGRRPLIPLAAPIFVGNEKRYVADCMDSGWISSNGTYVGRFEEAFATYCGVKHAIACCNGTAALHVALKALGIGHADEVLVPTLTFVATANAVTYCGARPVLVDVTQDAWNLDPALIEEKIGPQTKAIVAVHLYGYPAEMDIIQDIACRHGLFVVEDAAQAHGARYGDKTVGGLGDVATFSFFGNKILSTGEGGMVVTNDNDLAARVRLLRGQGMDPDKRYWFPVVGYNYRMTNIAAAIGLGQLECAEWHIEQRQEIAQSYVDALKSLPEVSWQTEKVGTRHANWLFTIALDERSACGRDELIARLAEEGIETRPVFIPMHQLPPYRDEAIGKSFPAADRISRNGLSLPTSSGMTMEEVALVCDALRRSLRGK